MSRPNPMEGVRILTVDDVGHLSPLQQLALVLKRKGIPPEKWAEALGLTPEEIVAAHYDLSLTARPIQTQPLGDWTRWWASGGRGSGKTFTSTKVILDEMKADPNARILLVGPTRKNIISTNLDGPSGLMTLAPPWMRLKHQPSKARVTAANGANDRTGLETLCRYGARGPLSLERLSLRDDGRLAWRMKRPAPDGSTHDPPPPPSSSSASSPPSCLLPGSTSPGSTECSRPTPSCAPGWCRRLLPLLRRRNPPHRLRLNPLRPSGPPGSGSPGPSSSAVPSGSTSSPVTPVALHAGCWPSSPTSTPSAASSATFSFLRSTHRFPPPPTRLSSPSSLSSAHEPFSRVSRSGIPLPGASPRPHSAPRHLHVEPLHFAFAAPVSRPHLSPLLAEPRLFALSSTELDRVNHHVRLPAGADGGPAILGAGVGAALALRGRGARAESRSARGPPGRAQRVARSVSASACSSASVHGWRWGPMSSQQVALRPCPVWEGARAAPGPRGPAAGGSKPRSRFCRGENRGHCPLSRGEQGALPVRPRAVSFPQQACDVVSPTARNPSRWLPLHPEPAGQGPAPWRSSALESSHTGAGP